MSEIEIESCNQNCAECVLECPNRTEEPRTKSNSNSFLKDPHKGSVIKHVVAVVSGKGGVGKSLVTSLMAVDMRRRGHRVAIMDADITGPSIPGSFGLEEERAMGTDEALLPTLTGTGIEVMSMNLLLENNTDPVVWRGPMIGGVVEQFWTDVMWGDVDYMFVDMPPGTGDVPLTVFQSLPVDGIIVVTSPQEMVGVIVEKAVNMARLMNIPIYAIVENMAYFECPDCGKRYRIFGESHVRETADRLGIPLVVSLPIDPEISKSVDAGEIEKYDSRGAFSGLADMLERIN